MRGMAYRVGVAIKDFGERMGLRLLRLLGMAITRAAAR
jgi:hypothetical protein